MVGLSTAQKKRLWDNVFVFSIIGGSLDTFEAIQNVLQTEHLYSIALDPEDLVSDSGLLRYLSEVTLLLPSDIFPLPEVPVPALEQLPEDDSIAEERAESFAEFVNYDKAAKELNTYYKKAFEKARLTTPSEDPEAEIPAAFDLIDDVIIAGMSEDTQAVMSTLGIGGEGEKFSIPFVLNLVQEQAKIFVENAAQSIDAYEQVFPIAGGLIVKSRIPTTSPDPLESVDELTPKLSLWDEFYGSGASCKVKPIGVADLRIVKQEWKCYKPGEIAHIENVLEGSTKERTTRRLTSTQTTETIRTESEKEEERDTQSTERYEMSSESSQIINSDTQFYINGGASGNFNFPGGSANIFANAGYSSGTSVQDSNTQALNYAKSVTDRAVKRILERTVRERTVTRIEEFEETNFTKQEAPDGHVVGIYRWVDKTYNCYVENYGKRTMFQFLVPEPAAFYLHALSKQAAKLSEDLKKPIHPGDTAVAAAYGIPCGGLRSHRFLTEINYHLYAAAYGAQVSPPPAQFVKVGKALNKESDMGDGMQSYTQAINDLVIPEGYLARIAKVKMSVSNHSMFAKCIVQVSAATVHATLMQVPGSTPIISGPNGNLTTYIYVGGFSGGITNYGYTHRTITLSGEKETLPISLHIQGSAIVNVEVECERSPELFEQWQIQTYEAIIGAYQRMDVEYKSALSEMQMNSDLGSQIVADNNPPDLNREIEMSELKKHCISLMRHGYGIPYINDSAIIENTSPCGYPGLDNCKAVQQGAVIQFLEQAFDWDFLAYKLYDYFWARSCQWKELVNMKNADPLFRKFLKAGAARVLVPVHPGYEKAVLYYLQTGMPWNGGPIPGINNDLYMDLIGDALATDNDTVGAPWEVRLPTNLVLLQEGAGVISETGLPCNE